MAAPRFALWNDVAGDEAGRLRPGDGHRRRAEKYQDVAVDLPAGVCAAGARPAACNELSAVMPVDLVVACTGHNLNGASALYEYVDPNRAILMAGGGVLAGWSAPPWGQLGRGPMPPSLEAISHLVESAKLRQFVDGLFQLDAASPVIFNLGGALRPLVEASCASLILYF